MDGTDILVVGGLGFLLWRAWAHRRAQQPQATQQMQAYSMPANVTVMPPPPPASSPLPLTVLQQPNAPTMVPTPTPIAPVTAPVVTTTRPNPVYPTPVFPGGGTVSTQPMRPINYIPVGGSYPSLTVPAVPGVEIQAPVTDVGPIAEPMLPIRNSINMM